VYFEDEGVTILDCIEFSDRLRQGDVCADVAFLSMDLAANRRVDLAERLLATYAREAGDFDLYAVVDFYEGYRAFVRGKIAAMAAAAEGLDAAARTRAAADARRYFLLALSADRRLLLERSVVAVGGVIGSGKSTVAAAIASETSAPVVDADRTRKAMLGVAANQRLDERAWAGAYDPAFTESVYAEVIRRAHVVLSSGRPVVVDASFRSRSLRSAARALAALEHVPFRFVVCQAPRDVCLERLARREGERGVSDGRRAIFDDFCARFEPIDELPSAEHLRLDTTRPRDELLAALRPGLSTWPGGLET
jgi:hypothetical protein